MDGKDLSPDRRAILRRLLWLGGLGATGAELGAWLQTRSHRPEQEPPNSVRQDHTVASNPSLPEMVVVQGDDPGLAARKAIEELGGIRRFVSRGDVVVIKPNASWDRTPEQAANTNPRVLAEVCRLCADAGARQVIVTDVSINDARLCFARSGLGAAAAGAGAIVVLPEERLFRDVDLRGEVLRSWPVLQPFLQADKVINIPIAKHHSLPGVTLGMKSWYGILGGPRHQLHQRIHESLVDLADFMRPSLTLIDAYRVLLRNGPGGGNLADVMRAKTVVAGTDPVAVDAYVAKSYWGLDWHTLHYLKMASDRHLGQLDLESVRTHFVAA
jgi:uncharacterized protein (DUF362 family)